MNQAAILDDAGFAQQLNNLRLSAEFATLQKECDALPTQGNIAAALRRLAIGKRIREIIIALGLALHPSGSAPQGQPSAAMPHSADAPPRPSTAHLYAYNPHRKAAQRKRENADALALLAQIDAGEVDADALSEAHKATLAKYSGTGGGLLGADGKVGSAYEYYTPAPIAAGAWDLLKEMGFTGGKVLDPCAGSGVFGATAPPEAVVDAVELNPTSGRINALLNQGAAYSVTIAPFERIAAQTQDESYDAVVANVPFGSLADRGENPSLDGRYQKEPLQNYFILRSLEKLRPGGLAAFIAPPRCVSGRGGKEEDLRIAASFMAEFLGAYRLPNSVFGTASADTITDLLVFRKYESEAQQKIAELREQAPDALIAANVQWQEFIQGKYFEGEGRRFVLGEFKPKNPDKFRDVDKVINPASVEEIGKLLKKFPASRVDWALLDARETQPIAYHDGDIIMQAGQTLAMRNGVWVALEKTAQSHALDVQLNQLADPYSAFAERVSYKDARTCYEELIASGRELDTPAWLRHTMTQLERLPDAASRSQTWNAGVVGLAVMQVVDERMPSGEVCNYLAEYPALSDAMQRLSSSAKRCRGISGQLKTGLSTLSAHYSKKKGFSAFWRGDVNTNADAPVLDAQASFEGLRYQTKSAWVTLEDAKRIFGADFAPLEDAAWCISSDGKSVTRADDYYVGNYGDFLRRMDADIAAAADEAIRAKLLRQKLAAQERIDKVDVSKLRFNLFSPHVTLEEKADFLRRFVHPAATVIFDEKTGEQRVDIDIQGSNLTDREKLFNRFGDYLKNGSITLGGAKLTMSDTEALKRLRAMVNTANEQFNNWSRGNHTITARLQTVAGNPDTLRFRQADDESPLEIAGMSPDMKGYGYQNAFIRRQGREFGGGNGFDVGLGKTWTSLASVQHAHNIGIKKKTAFIVPSSVLSNWRKEAGQAYINLDDCLFIGLREGKDGRADVASSQFDADLLRVLENRHRKIFMTVEAFSRIKLRDETIADFKTYMRKVDASFSESDDKKTDERAKGKQAGALNTLYNKRGAAPYLEDMGIDSLVFDEAHLHKNSAQTVDFSGAKFLSVSPASQRGLDAQAKAWYVRSGSALQDGVLCLSATPITNSPLEVYSMLSLAVGHARVNDMCVGIKGADHFMNMMCEIENQDDVSIDGVFRTVDVFVGLSNAQVLRNAVSTVYTIKTAEDVSAQIVMPGSEEVETRIALPESTIERLSEYKGAFRFAIDELTKKKENRGDAAAYDAVAKRFGYGMRLIGHPFNLINTMTLEIADPELGERTICYLTPPSQAELAAKAVADFNAKRYREERPRPYPRTQTDAIVSRKAIKDKVTGKESEVLTIEVRAVLEADGRVVIDSIDPAIQNAFEALADSMQLTLDVTIPPKLAALLANFQKEQAAPRGVMDDGAPSPIVKQIIFCDILPLHNKIKRLLMKHAGVPAAAIAIITGKINNSADEILQVQNGFNAHGTENQYRVIIANEKAEVGINLQKGTQAIHHLTIGWTPDSLHQRNGRGVRQGNHTASVRIYQYDADGTFDCSKRLLVEKKADWIGEVMNPNGSGDGGNFVAVSGGLSNEQLEALIETVGDGEAMRRMQSTIAAQEAQARASSNRERQMINLDSIQKQAAWLAGNASAQPMLQQKVLQCWKMHCLQQTLLTRIGNPQASASAVAKNEALLADTEIKMAALRREIEASAVIQSVQGRVAKDTTLDALLQDIDGTKKRKDGEVLAMISGRSWPEFRLTVRENSPLQREWEAEVGMARTMIAECQAGFMEQARADGALPPSVVTAIVAGKGRAGGGLAVVDNSFFRLDDGHLGLVDFENFTVQTLGPNGRSEKQTIGWCLNKHSIIYPDTPDYDACLTDAAALEDAINSQGLVENSFSERVPEIAQRRKTPMLCAYDIARFLLPQPYFPIVLEPDMAKTPVSQRIVAEQSRVVKAVRGKYNTVFVVDSALEVSPWDTLDMLDALRDYAIANQMQLVLADMRSKTVLQRYIQQALPAANLTAGITASNEPDIRAQAEQLVRQAVPWFDFAEHPPLHYDFLGYDLHRALSLAIKKAIHAALEQTMLPTDVVGISGNSYPWKETIMSIAGEGGYRYDDQARVWNVRRSTWDYLAQQYASSAGTALILCAATQAL